MDKGEGGVSIFSDFSLFVWTAPSLQNFNNILKICLILEIFYKVN